MAPMVMRNHFALLVGLPLCFAAACNRSSAPMTPTPPDWMEPELSRIAQSLVPEAQQIGDTLKAVAFEEDDHMEWMVNLEAGSCYIITGVGDQTVEEMTLELKDPEDDDVVDETNAPPRVAMEWCTVMPGLYKLHAQVREGHGHYQAAVFLNPKRGSAPAPVPAPADPAPAKPKPQPAKTDLEAAIIAMAKSSASGSEQVGDFFEGSADKTDWYTALDSSKCYWFLGAGDDSISELHLYLWDPDDKRITANKSETNRVNVGHCPTVSGMFHFQAKVNAGSGSYKVGVYAKKK
jgi:hypothetical protein